MNKNESYIYRIRRNAIGSWKRYVQRNNITRELSQEEFYEEMQMRRQQVIKIIEAGAICSPSIEDEGKPGKANYFIINDIGEGRVCKKCGHTGTVILSMDKKRLKKLDMKVYRPSFETYYNLRIDPSDCKFESMSPIPVNYKKDFWYCPYCNELHRFKSNDGVHVEYDQDIFNIYEDTTANNWDIYNPFELSEPARDCLKVINELETAMEKSVTSQNKSSSRPTDSEMEQAKISGKPVLIAKWMEPCNDPSEECSWDYIKRYILPNGQIKDNRTHTY